MKMLIGTFEEKYKNTMLSVDAGFLFEFSSVMSQKFYFSIKVYRRLNYLSRIQINFKRLSEQHLHHISALRILAMFVFVPQNIQPYTAGITLNILIPIQCFHIERKQGLILGIHILPELLHVAIIEVPLTHREGFEQEGDLLHFAVDFHHSEMLVILLFTCFRHRKISFLHKQINRRS